MVSDYFLNHALKKKNYEINTGLRQECFIIFYSLGSTFCPSMEKAMIRVHLIYSELSYVKIEEKDSYPLEEMINEFAGVASLYFGFSAVSVLALICKLIYQLCIST